MTLDLEDEYGLDLGFDYEKTATEVINQVLEEEGCPYEAQVNLRNRRIADEKRKRRRT